MRIQRATNSAIRRSTPSRRALTRTELLALIVCLLLLLVVAMVIFNGRGKPNIDRLKDAAQIRALDQCFVVYAREFYGARPIPSLMMFTSRKGVETSARGGEDISLNTTANLFSACIMQNYLNSQMCISPAEANPNVKSLAADDYNYESYSVLDDTMWDSTFKADLQTGSNVSYAHMPLFGELRARHWRQTLGGADWPMLGNRGPRDGISDPNSYTFKFYEPHDQWSGNICFADGHVEYLEGLPTSHNANGGMTNTQGLFRYDKEHDADGILSFTKSMNAQGPTLQWD